MNDDRQNLPPDPDEINSLDAYLDDQLQVDARARFEETIARDPMVRAQIERQKAINLALTRMFAASAPSDALRKRIRPAIEYQPAAPARLRIGKLMAIAASVVFLILGPYEAWQTWAPNLFSATPIGCVPRELDVVYNENVSNGFTPMKTCHTPADSFDAEISARFNEPIGMKPLPANVRAVGMDFPSTMSPNTTTLLAKVSDAPVIVFADLTSNDRGQKLTSDSKGLHMFRREVGPIVLYEVTPLDRPTILELLYFKQ